MSPRDGRLGGKTCSEHQPLCCFHRPADPAVPLQFGLSPHLIINQCALSLLTLQTHVFRVCSWMLVHILLEYFVYCYIIKLEGTLWNVE